MQRTFYLIPLFRALNFCKLQNVQKPIKSGKLQNFVQFSARNKKINKTKSKQSCPRFDFVLGEIIAFKCALVFSVSIWFYIRYYFAR